ncbi:GNAT family N-acetyltransferase [Pseudooceanicola spongiae]|uniref:GNAT family N-acetyltransferase n=1 Tax=Pseudooceanicola spongiae TaxID=2613965 RepID=A0A7L9WNX2_9RHOB|nr:GNAT family N-acetyltransferase [Pseudooceanicola spongiae]QOL81643.1 GNAT family N-acetyltransferase [Pseudooceanicola spongiae]|tara:strand:+ start:222 stop:770 length:549 start_codon:yes stop_codon:yes gene_type:complete
MSALGTPAHDLPIPVLETERLILRGPAPQDFAPMAELMSDAERSRFIGGPRTEENDHWRGFIAMIGHWMWRGYGYWTIVEKATDRPVGRTGVTNHITWDEPELGWHLFAGCEGKGYATEAARAARLHVAQAFGLDRVISYIDPENAPSRAVALRLGATVERDGEVLGHPVQVFRHPSALEGV